MQLLVDTSVWSLFLRRKNPDTENYHVQRLRYHLKHHDYIYLIGVVLQELLDGIKSEKHVDLLIEYLRPFPLLDPRREDFIDAARLKTFCRSKGVQAGSIDFLIAAVCINRNIPLLSADNDFSNICKWCTLKLD